MTTTKKTTTTKKKTAAKPKVNTLIISKPAGESKAHVTGIKETPIEGSADPFKAICGNLEAMKVPDGCIVKSDNGLCFVPKVKLQETKDGTYKLVDGR